MSFLAAGTMPDTWMNPGKSDTCTAYAQLTHSDVVWWMDFSINMQRPASTLRKFPICWAYAHLTSNSAQDDDFARCFGSQFHREVSTEHAENMPYIAIYYHIYLYTVSSLKFLFFLMVKISIVCIQHLLTHLLILLLCPTLKLISCIFREMDKLFWKIKHMHSTCSR